MRTFIFLFCVTVFSLTPNNVLSQNAKINIETDKTVTVDEIFDLIMSQTDYTFIYQVDMFKGFPKVSLKKGIIRANKLLKKSLAKGNFNFQLSDKNTIVIKEVNKTLQQVTVTGQVVDENGLPIPGITIYVLSQKPVGENINQDFLIRATATDIDGKYSIIADEGNHIAASGVGYGLYTEEIVSGKLTYNMSLNELISALEEVMIVGYGSAKKKDLTGSVGSVTSKEIKQIKAQTIDQALVGKIPGVFVTANSGGPGGGSIVNIRGLSAIRGDNQPLYVIDGVPIIISPQFSVTGSDVNQNQLVDSQANPLLSVNPDDIERVDVLKDASAAAIYGSRAANGVIIVTTKRGRRNQKPNFNLSYSSTFQNPTNTLDFLNGDQFRTFITENGFAAPEDLGTANTDWQDLITNDNALWEQYNFSVSGGTENVNYLMSAAVTDQKGSLLGTKFKRYSFNSNLDVNITKKLKTGASINYNHSTNDRSGITNFGEAGSFRPDLDVFNPDGTFTTNPGAFGLILRNPIGGLAKITNRTISQSIIGNAYGEYELLKGLKFRSQISVIVGTDESNSFAPSFTQDAQFEVFRFGELNPGDAILRLRDNTTLTTSFANTLSYNKTFNDAHTLNAVVGVSWDRSRSDILGLSFSGFPDDEVLINPNSAQRTHLVTSATSQAGLNSFFGRLNYNYKDRYLVTFTGRSDASIKFGPENRRGFFPSGAVAWNAHNEDFLKNNATISQLKLRASYGITGNDNLAAFTFVPTIGSFDDFSNTTFFDNVLGIAITGVPNPAIKWEQTQQLDLGLEFGLFNGRLNGEIVYFEKNTSDLILLVPIAAQNGAPNYNANVADLSNKGWEFNIGGDVIRNKNFRWNSSFNISFLKNEVESLNNGSLFGTGGFLFEGEPLGVIRGFEVVGIAQTQEEVDALNAGAPDGQYFNGLDGPGDYIFADINGDGEVNAADDRVTTGDINPDFFGGWNNTLSYKNFDFSFNLQFVSGNDLVWTRASGGGDLSNPQLTISNVTDIVFDAWTPENTDAEFARIGSRTHLQGNDFSSTVFDASYIRLRSASIGYNLPKKWLGKTSVKNAKLTLSGNNLFTITSYPGVDPEGVNPQRAGFLFDRQTDGDRSFPLTRTFTLGFNLSF